MNAYPKLHEGLELTLKVIFREGGRIITAHECPIHAESVITETTTYHLAATPEGVVGGRISIIPLAFSGQYLIGNAFNKPNISFGGEVNTTKVRFIALVNGASIEITGNNCFNDNFTLTGVVHAKTIPAKTQRYP